MRNQAAYKHVSDGFYKLINYFDGPQELARRLGITAEAISNWVRRGKVPISRLHQLEKLTKGRVTARELRPDLFD